jgi:methylenetetrahydrofolate dehydrogenase (NADP+)/methenyltetrahydrofolate cyclohydrolase
MILFDGRKYSAELDVEIAEFVKSHSNIGKLLLIQIGEDSASRKYIQLKSKLCQKFDIPVETLFISENHREGEIFSEVRSHLNEKATTGAIIQLPLPSKNLQGLLDSIPTTKDVDRLSSTSQDQFYQKKFKKLPPVIRALNLFLEKNSITVSGKSVFVVGEGFLVGKPVSFYLRTLGAHVTVIRNYKTGTKLNCQLLVLSAGIPNLVNSQDLNDGCDVVDFGSTVVDGKITGDLSSGDDTAKLSHLGSVSLSPGGVGPLVVRYLIMNHLGI